MTKYYAARGVGREAVDTDTQVVATLMVDFPLTATNEQIMSAILDARASVLTKIKEGEVS